MNMNLRKIRTFAGGLVVASLAFAQFGCEADWMKEYDSSKMLAANTATITVGTIEDSTAVLNYSISNPGRLYVLLLTGTNETATPTITNMQKPTASLKAAFSQEIILEDPAALSGSVKVSKLIPSNSYKVFVLPANTDQVVGEIVTTDAFTTADHIAPTLDMKAGISPAISSVASQTIGFKPKLTFSEPVKLAAEFVIQLGYYNPKTGATTFVDVPKDSIKISSNVLTISQPVANINGQYVFLTIGANSILDRANQPLEGVTSGIVGGKLTGIYWRVKNAAKESVVYPNDGYIRAADTKFVLDFPYKMRFPSTSEGGYNSSKVIIRYVDGGTDVRLEVPKSSITFTQDTLVNIAFHMPLSSSMEVYLMMEEGALYDVYGNKSAAEKYDDNSWYVSYNYAANLIISPYTVDVVSYFAAQGGYVGLLDANIVAGEKAGEVKINGLVKQFFGLANEVSIPALYNKDEATLIIAGKILLGDLLADGGKVYFQNADDSSVDYVQFVESDGSFDLDLWGFYYKHPTDSEQDGWLEVFTTSTWDKTTKKSVNKLGVKPTVRKAIIK